MRAHAAVNGRVHLVIRIVSMDLTVKAAGKNIISERA